MGASGATHKEILFAMKTFVIAEAGVNHNGSLDMALSLVDEASRCRADAVKFQTFNAARLATRGAPKAAYQSKRTEASESQYEMLRKLELDRAAHEKIAAHCASAGIEFLSTPFDLESVRLLADLGVKRLKLPSGELTNAPLLFAAANTGLPILLSTGMARLGEVEEALGVLACGYLGRRPQRRSEVVEVFASENGQRALTGKVAILHCTTEYPAPAQDVNLRAMETLRSAFGLPVGLSDHTEGSAAAIAAVALGASIIEKHFTLDRQLPGPDHKASLEPGELLKLISDIRIAEIALGKPLKAPVGSEQGNINIARKSLVALLPIRKGELFTNENLGVKRPGGGISPLDYWDWLGRPAQREYQPDDLIAV
jgi:N-acetylneuraminate synthase